MGSKNTKSKSSEMGSSLSLTLSTPTQGSPTTGLTVLEIAASLGSRALRLPNSRGNVRKALLTHARHLRRRQWTHHERVAGVRRRHRPQRRTACPPPTPPPPIQSPTA